MRVLLVTLSVVLTVVLFALSVPEAAAQQQVFNMIVEGGAVNGTDGFTTLGSANGIAIAEVGGTTYVLTTAITDDGIQVARLNSDGTLTATDAVTDGNEQFEILSWAYDVATAQVGSSTYVLTTSLNDDGIQVARLNSDGTLTATDAVTDGNEQFEILSWAYDVATAQVGSSTYVLTTSLNDDGIQVARLNSDGTLTATDAVTDESEGFDKLDGSIGITTAQIGGITYVFSAAGTDDGIQVARLNSDGTLTAVSSATDNTGGFTTLDGAQYVTVAEVGGSTYVVVTADATDDGIQVARLNSDGTLTPTDEMYTENNDFKVLEGAKGVATVTVDGDTYVLVAAFDEHGIQAAQLGTNGTLTAVNAVTDGNEGFEYLNSPQRIAIAEAEGNTWAFVASSGDNGIQVVRLTDRPPVLHGIGDVRMSHDWIDRTIRASASDADGDSIKFDLVSSPSFIHTSDSGIITISPGPGDVSSTPYTVTVRATSQGLSDNETFRVTVTAGGGPDPMLDQRTGSAPVIGHSCGVH